MRRGILASCLCAVALIGCGGDDAPDASSEAAATREAGGWVGTTARTYESARKTCSSFPRAQLTQDLGLERDATVAEMAERYAAPSTEQHRKAAYEGCLAGLR
jgi:hypothetical protein